MTTAILAISDWPRSETAPPRAWRPDWRRLVGATIVAGGLLHLAALAGQSVAAFLGAHADVRAATFASLLAGAATGLGALPLLVLSRISERTRDGALGFGAGVMLAAAAFSLLLPAIEMAGRSGALTVALGFLAGGVFLTLCDRLLPHRHLSGDAHGIGAENVRRVWLFVFAMALHNLPEGLAVGVAYTDPEATAAPALAFGIGIQNMPEGLVTALALMGAGYGRIAAVALATGTGLLEPVAAAFGSALVAGTAPLLPPAMAFAAGAMVFVVSHEIIPESHRRGHETHATVGVMVGFALMMVLDTAFGGDASI
jgi:ZIP family zinc transporter